MNRFENVNPFSKRDTHSAREIWVYKTLTVVSWLLSLIVSFYYSIHAPHDGRYHGGSIWGQNRHYHTAFSLNAAMVCLYWIVLFISQLGYVWTFFSTKDEWRTAAANVGSHFIFNNLLHFAFVMLFVRSHFVWAEIILIINYFNLASLYFRHPTTPRSVHVPAITGPLAWTFVAIFWNGAIMAGAEGLAARIVANVFVWAFLLYGMFFLLYYKDYTMGFNLAFLTAALGVGQFLRQVFALQWIFAFVIMAVLFLFALLIGVPSIMGKDINLRREAPAHDQERAPLLQDNN